MTNKQVLGSDDVRRAITRMAHEIIERNRGTSGVALVGIQTGGVWVAEALAAEIARIDQDASDTNGGSADRSDLDAGDPGDSGELRIGSVDVSLYRDDIGLRPVSPGAVSDLTFSVDDVTVVLVDDVLYTGRTVRAAIDAICDYGRPRAVQLAVIVDRGHRELPIRPDFVGKNLPTSSEESVAVTADGVVIS